MVDTENNAVSAVRATRNGNITILSGKSFIDEFSLYLALVHETNIPKDAARKLSRYIQHFNGLEREEEVLDSLVEEKLTMAALDSEKKAEINRRADEERERVQSGKDQALFDEAILSDRLEQGQKPSLEELEDDYAQYNLPDSDYYREVILRCHGTLQSLITGFRRVLSLMRISVEEGNFSDSVKEQVRELNSILKAAVESLDFVAVREFIKDAVGSAYPYLESLASSDNKSLILESIELIEEQVKALENLLNQGIFFAAVVKWLEEVPERKNIYLDQEPLDNGGEEDEGIVKFLDITPSPGQNVAIGLGEEFEVELMITSTTHTNKESLEVAIHTNIDTDKWHDILVPQEKIKGARDHQGNEHPGVWFVKAKIKPEQAGHYAFVAKAKTKGQKEPV